MKTVRPESQLFLPKCPTGIQGLDESTSGGRPRGRPTLVRRNETMLRSELRPLFRWLKDRGVTAVITAERGHESLSRHGLEEYVSDCVVLLDHRVNDDRGVRTIIGTLSDPARVLVGLDLRPAA